MLRVRARSSRFLLLAVLSPDIVVEKYEKSIMHTIIRSSGINLNILGFSCFTEKSMAKASVYQPILEIIPSSGSKNDTSINPIKIHSTMTSAGSSIEIKCESLESVSSSYA